MHKFVALFAATCLAAPALSQDLAQDPAQDPAQDDEDAVFDMGAAFGFAGDGPGLAADDFDLDSLTPTRASLVVLGAAPNNSADTGVFRDFGIDFISFGDGGSSKLGLGFAVAPYWVGNRPLTLEDYRHDTAYWERLAARSSLSFGIAASVGSPRNAIEAGFALETQLLDIADHRYDDEALSCVTDAFDRYNADAGQQATQAMLQARLQNPDISEREAQAVFDDTYARLTSGGEFGRARRSCQNLALIRNLARPSWIVGLGASVRAERDEINDVELDGGAVWTTLRLPVGPSRRAAYMTRGEQAPRWFPSVLVIGRGDFDRTFNLADDRIAKGDGVQGGLGLQLQSAKWRFDTAAIYTYRDYDQGLIADDDFVSVSGVVSRRIRQGLWLQGAVGGQFGGDFNEDIFFNVSVKAGFDDIKRWLTGGD